MLLRMVCVSQVLFVYVPSLQVWVYLEEQSYLQAAECFLLARYVSCQLSLAVPPSSSSTVDRLWHPIAAFKDTLLEVSLLRLTLMQRVGGVKL